MRWAASTGPARRGRRRHPPTGRAGRMVVRRNADIDVGIALFLFPRAAIRAAPAIEPGNLAAIAKVFGLLGFDASVLIQVPIVGLAAEGMAAPMVPHQFVHFRARGANCVAFVRVSHGLALSV